MKKKRILFILKRREDYKHHPVTYSEHGISTGLLNSATFVHDMLVKNDFESKVVVVVDNNDIDREVVLFKPTHVIIEALWVVPEKFDVLTKLHPKVKWLIRFHSEMPFIAGEGIAMKWIFGYMHHRNVILCFNSPRLMEEVIGVLKAADFPLYEIHNRTALLPNYYPVEEIVMPNEFDKTRTHINIGCFGAIRPLKNHLIQAVAALHFANQLGLKLRFHINIGRIEGRGDPVLHNLVEMFIGLKEQGHELVMHSWTPHEKFKRILNHIDIGMQVTFTETFNIVTADMVTSGIPVVVSSEVPWTLAGHTDPNDYNAIVKALHRAWNHKLFNVVVNTVGLMYYTMKSERTWIKFLQHR